MSYTLLTGDARALDTPDPPGDMNNANDVLIGMGASFNVLNTAYAGGADPLGSADSAAAFQAAVTAAIAAGADNITIPPGTYTVSSTVTCAVPGFYIRGAGINATIINFTGTGDCFRMYWAGAYVGGGTPSSVATWGGGVSGLTIDGTGAGAGSSGIHMGDIFDLYVDCVIRNFTGSGSIGAHFDNTVHWTERLHGRVGVINCTQNVVFDVSGALTSTNSFARCDLDIYVNQENPAYDGVVCRNGAVPNDGKLKIRGNFNGSNSVATTAAVLRITGAVPAGHPSAGGFSNILSCQLDINVECPSFTNTAATILFGTSSNVINECYGLMDFAVAGVNFSQSNWNLGGGGFFGPIYGDVSLAGLSRSQAPIKLDNGFSIGHFQTSAMTNGATITTAGRTQTLTTGVGSGVTGIIMQAGTLDGQIIVVINQSGSGTVTFAASGTSNVADGTSDVIPALAARMFSWSAATSLWYRMA